MNKDVCCSGRLKSILGHDPPTTVCTAHLFMPVPWPGNVNFYIVLIQPCSQSQANCSQAEYFNITFAACAVTWACQSRSCSFSNTCINFQPNLLSLIIFQTSKLPSRNNIILAMKQKVIKLQAFKLHTETQHAIYTEILSLFHTEFRFSLGKKFALTPWTIYEKDISKSFLVSVLYQIAVCYPLKLTVFS